MKFGVRDYDYKYDFTSNRLAGASLVAPVINYWWSNLPKNMSREAYYKSQLPQDKWSLRVANYKQWINYWW